MPNSEFTKKALKSALWELVEEMPFEKITISQICEKCGMNRNSFYYHFRDKYDLVNWIFDTDFRELAKDHTVANWEMLKALCTYLYENRSFYQKIFKVEGQNSFSEHFQEFLYPMIYERVKLLLDEDEIHPLCVNFLVDGIICTIKRWLLEKDTIPPDQFVSMLKSIIHGTAIAVFNETEPT